MKQFHGPSTFTFITGNPSKAASAQRILSKKGITFTHRDIPLIEIQSQFPEDIALYKVHDAFRKLKTPVLINDAFWEIPALNGFPGPYMHHINKWLTNDDFLALMKNKHDRTIIRTTILVYKDKFTQKVFTNTLNGFILEQPKGEGLIAFDRIITLRRDKKSAAQCDDEKIDSTDTQTTVWDKFIPWYLKTVKSTVF